MADVTGVLHHEFGGKTYPLKLSFLVLAELQGRHGMDCLSRLGSADGKSIPDFGLIVDVVTRALMRGARMAEDEARDLADDMVTADQSIIPRLLSAAFPDAMAVAEGKAAPVGNRKAAAA